MNTHFHLQNLEYDGRQLHSHFAYKNFGILGDSAVAFIGPCEVKLEKMVDLEDVRKNAPIYSPCMLHFILELFGWNLSQAVLWQRLCVSIIREELEKLGIGTLQRRGNDLYCGEKKFNVSIATISPISALIHIGLNIETEGTPVATIGLSDWKILPEDFGKRCLQSFQREYFEVQKSTYKVRAVD